MGDVYEYAHTSPTQLMDTTAGTLFGAYNAITGYYQNVKDYKNAFELCIKASDFLN